MRGIVQIRPSVKSFDGCSEVYFDGFQVLTELKEDGSLQTDYLTMTNSRQCCEIPAYNVYVGGPPEVVYDDDADTRAAADVSNPLYKHRTQDDGSTELFWWVNTDGNAELLARTERQCRVLDAMFEGKRITETSVHTASKLDDNMLDEFVRIKYECDDGSFFVLEICNEHNGYYSQEGGWSVEGHEYKTNL